MSNREQIDDKPQPGSFSYIERQIIKGSATGAAAAVQGRQFEDLCAHYLSIAPEYRGTFKRIWRWRDWPDNWGADKGIDLVALTNDGKYWAIQAKAFDSAHSIKKEEIDSFLSESSRPTFAYRLLIATTDRIGANAREVLKGQEKPVGQRLRTDLLQAELVWPTEVGGAAKPLPRKDPREDQKQAIADALSGFDQNKRGQLVMACGSGKTLTALWIAENLNARLVLLLVPSLSLVGQTLTEWRRSARKPFRYLVVCSDETVIRGEDATVHSTRDLGVPVTTDVGDVRRFINESNESTTSYVFCTYQSSPVVADAQTRATQSFDLVIADEAHRCAGAKQTAFGTVLDEKRIKAKRRLFMTATPRYFTGRVKKRAAELEYEIASMDDEALFGPVFHKLTFNAAIAAGLLTDYQVVVIGVSDKESKRWAEEGTLVRTRGGATTDARTLASQIGLAKATRKYDLRRVITFHSSKKRPLCSQIQIRPNRSPQW